MFMDSLGQTSFGEGTAAEALKGFVDRILQNYKESFHGDMAASQQLLRPAWCPGWARPRMKLFRLHRASDFNAPITACIYWVEPHENVSYEAISYSVGDPRVTVEITVDYAKHAVSPNLASALRQFRNKDSDRVLWADAICINQEDHEERAYSVARMHQIYSKADRTLVWLGEDFGDQDGDKALTILRLIGADLGFTEGAQAVVAFYRRFIPIRDNAGSYSESQMREFNAFASILSRPWWERVWVVQEVAVATKCTIYWGNNPADWVTCARAIDVLKLAIKRLVLPRLSEEQLASRVGSNLQHFQSIEHFKTTRNDFHERKAVDLISLLVKTRHCAVTDPRDKIFGIQNLCNQEGDIPIAVDYHMTPAELFTLVARGCIEARQDLAILAACEKASNEGETSEDMRQVTRWQRHDIPGLPSWAPNWAAERLAKPLFGGIEDSINPLAQNPDFKPYKAAGNLPASFSFDFEDTDQPKLITKIGTLDKVTSLDLTRALSAKQNMYALMDEVESAIKRIFRLSALPSNELITRMAFKLCSTERSVEGLDMDSAGTRFETEDQFWLDSANALIQGRRLFYTLANAFGLGPRGMQVGDELLLVPGCHVPMVMRELGFGVSKSRTCSFHAESCSIPECEGRRIPKYQVIGEACRPIVHSLHICTYG